MRMTKKEAVFDYHSTNLLLLFLDELSMTGGRTASCHNHEIIFLNIGRFTIKLTNVQISIFLNTEKTTGHCVGRIFLEGLKQ